MLTEGWKSKWQEVTAEIASQNPIIQVMVSKPETAGSMLTRYDIHLLVIFKLISVCYVTLKACHISCPIGTDEFLSSSAMVRFSLVARNLKQGISRAIYPHFAH